MAETLKIESTTERTIHPARNLIGTLRLPGDKSISHRYALLGGLAEGVSRFHNFSTGADCASSLECMRQMGAKVTRSGTTVEIEGCGGTLTPPGITLDCGNSGSTMRMLAGLLAGQAGEFRLEGDASLNRRPMERVRKPLLEMGAAIQSDRWTCAGRDHRLEAARDQLPDPGSQRPGENSFVVCGVASGGYDHGERRGAYARPWRTGSARVRG